MTLDDFDTNATIDEILDHIENNIDLALNSLNSK